MTETEKTHQPYSTLLFVVLVALFAWAIFVSTPFSGYAFWPLLFLGAIGWAAYATVPLWLPKWKENKENREKAYSGLSGTVSSWLVEESVDVTFEDVAGCKAEKHELKKIIRYLRDPEHYKRLGAEVPKGVLLVGPPGTGKTLIARAVAGEVQKLAENQKAEADREEAVQGSAEDGAQRDTEKDTEARVAFFQASGSDFTEVYVGLGASRVRELFAAARDRVPAIIFIDEVDGVGAKRGAATNREDDKTLNAMLGEIDGFLKAEGVIVIAATNRPDILDMAFVRAGRFDWQIEIPVPNQSDREQILKVHTTGKKHKPLAGDVDLRDIARRLPGATGADLGSIANEAALFAAEREDAEFSTNEDWTRAIDKIRIGLEKDGSKLSKERRRRIAVHETGHALVAMLQNESLEIEKLTIVGRGGTLGHTAFLSDEDSEGLRSESQCMADLAWMLGGYAAEDIVLGETTTGPDADIGQATALADAMVTQWGMSTLGPRKFTRAVGSQYLEQETSRLDLSPVTQWLVDRRISAILRRAERKARRLITERRETFDEVVELLIEENTLTGEQLRSIIDGRKGEARATVS